MIGQDYTLNCDAQFQDTTDQVTFAWLGPDGDPVPTTDTRRVETQGLNSQLQFLPIQESHAGNYTCQVSLDSNNAVGLTNRAEVEASGKD